MSSLRRNMMWMAMSQGGIFVTQFTATVIIARLLNPYEMGVFAAALAVVGLLAVVRNLGLGSYVIRAPALTPALVETTFTINALLALLIAVMVIGLSLLGGAVLDEPGVRMVLLALVPVPLLSILEFRPATIMERQGRFGGIAAVNMVRAATGAALSVAMALEGHSYMSLAYGQLAGAAVGAIGFNLVGWRNVSLRLGLANWRDVVRYGLHMLAISGTSVAATRLAELAMARLLGLVSLGIYARAGGVANMVWENVHLIVSRALFVDLAEQHRRGLPLRESYLRVTTLATAVLWPAFAGLAVLSGPVILALYGPQWVEAQVTLSLLSLSFITAAAMIAAGAVLVVTGQTGRQARLEAARSLAGLSMFLAGCMFGLEWAAATRIVEGLLAYAIYRRLVERMTGTSASDFTAIFLRSAALMGVAVGPVFFVMAWHGWSPQAPRSTLGLAVLVGILLWMGLLYRMRHPLLAEAMWWFRRLRAQATTRHAR